MLRQKLHIGREREPDTYIPYVGHANDSTLLLDDGSTLMIGELEGVEWETENYGIINSQHSQLNVLFRNLANERLMISTHVVRSVADPSVYPRNTFRTEFAASLDRAWQGRLFGEKRLYRNRLFFSVLLRPSQIGGNRVSRWLNRRRKGDAYLRPTPRHVRRLEASMAKVMTELSDYKPKLLGLTTGDSGVTFSEPARALHLILTGEDRPIPLVRGHMGGAIYQERVIVGHETIEIRGAKSSVFAAGFGLREYPAKTWPGMFDSVLTASYRCCLTQTFGFLTKQAGIDRMGRKQNQMVVSGDKAGEQVADLDTAMNDLQSNKFVMGDNHVTLLVFADTLPDIGEIASEAQRALAESGAVVVREDLALEALYWAQLPGNHHLRTRPGVISSRNFAAMSALHNYQSGKPTGHWGAPLTIARTSGGTARFLHLHASTSLVTDLGNIFVCGPAGSGKTTTLLTLLTFADAQADTVVFFDKDAGGEIWARAMGASCVEIPNGRPSGLAPLKALTASPEDIGFLAVLTQSLIRAGNTYEITPDEEKRILHALRIVMRHPVEQRTFSEVRAFLGASESRGAGAYLAKWCQGGELGWVFDNDEDHLDTTRRYIWIDRTHILDHPLIRGPIQAYLYHRIEPLTDGRNYVIAIDEFWMDLQDEHARSLVNDKLKTLRKLNGLVILATQSAADAIASPIAHTIREQCPTQIYTANPRAEREDYVDGCKLTQAEFEIVKDELQQQGWCFLLKQDAKSAVCDLDLSGCHDIIAVLSGREKPVQYMHDLIGRHGAEPADWLPHFRQHYARDSRAPIPILPRAA